LDVPAARLQTSVHVRVGGERARSAWSNAQYEQLNKSDTDQQHRKRHVIVFEPIPIIGKHHIHPYFNGWALKEGPSLLINLYRTPVSGVFRRKDSGFAVCGENPASVSRFMAGIRRVRIPSTFRLPKTRFPSEPGPVPRPEGTRRATPV
jgi:hypothetical protein